MNYIDLINQFWELNKEHFFNSNEIAVYFALLNKANSFFWKNPFKQPTKIFTSELVMSEPTFKRCRNRLKQIGLIDFNSGGKNIRDFTEYYILGVNHLPPSVPPSVPPNNKDKDKDKDKEKRKKENFDFSNIDSKFHLIINDWLEYKKLRRELPKNQKSFETMCNKLLRDSNGNTETAKIIIENSIGNNYQGFFPIKNGFQKQNNTQDTMQSVINIINRRNNE